MKSPAVIHFKCLDTFALQGVARSFGRGAAGVRLTHDGLEAHVRPSRRTRDEDAALAAREAEVEKLRRREETEGTLAPHVAEVAPIAPIALPAPSTMRASMASLATIEAIETGLRRPTTWAVLLLTLGISFGVVIARAASNAGAVDAATTSAASLSPYYAPSSPVAPAPELLAESPGHAMRASAAAPLTLSPTTITAGRALHTPHARASTEAPRADAIAEAKVDAKREKADGGDETAAAAETSEQVKRELSDSL